MEINAFLEHKESDTPNVMLVKKLYKAMTMLREIQNKKCKLLCIT